MADNTNPNASKNLSSSFLPNFYRTDANKKFLQATIEQLIQPGTVKKVNGYIGRQNSKATTGSDIFVSASDTDRQNYQLEPGLVIKDELNNTTFFKDYIDYINQLKVFGSDVSNHARINKQEFYSWDPHIDWDKFVNFQNYYWMPYGPDVIRIYGQREEIISTYTVNIESEGNNNTYVFTPDGLVRNPTLKLFRGQTYKFEINSPGNPFSFKLLRSSGQQDRYITDAIDNHSVENGTITFTVPYDAPDVIYYQSENDTDLGGVVHINAITSNSEINVEVALLGKKTYTLSDGTSLSNGMKVTFGGEVTPAHYSSGSFYVEGVGKAIRLVPEEYLELVSAYTTSESVLFDSTPFDKSPFSDATAYAGTPDYIVINRASRDRNPWSRYNRWFHKDVIETSAKLNGNTVSLDQSYRAIRAIIEFEADLKLFNFGTESVTDVDLIDNFTTDVFSDIEGSLGYNIDGIDVINGHRILFTADPDIMVKNKIYQVQLVDFERLTVNGVSVSRQIHLVEISEPVSYQVALIHQGTTNQGEMYWYDGNNWNKGQQKTILNQPPLFDMVDENGNSFGDIDIYDGSSFNGTKLFSYKVGTGTTDVSLGFPLTYKNVNNIGDIVFNFNLISDTFRYKDISNVIVKSIDTGFLVKKDFVGNTIYLNGWQKNVLENTQAAIRIYKNTTDTNTFDIDIFDDINDLEDLQVKIYINGIRVDSTKWSIESGPTYKTVVLNTAITATDVLTIRAFAAQAINQNGYYEIPLNLQNNPLNESIGDFTLGEVIDHATSIVDNLTTFTGSFPGASNLRDLGNVTKYGTKFIQHSGPASLSLYHITNQSNNIIRAIEKSRDDYGNFKRNFLKVSETLGVDTNPVAHVDLVLQEINKDKPNTFPYYFSDMVPYGSNIKTTLTVVDYRIKTYPLTNVFSLDVLSNSSVLVYLNDVHLLHGRDYTFDSQGFIVISATLVNDDTIIIYEYENTDGSFVPETPTKLGIWPKYEPKIYVDTTYVTPRTMIQGHDGSQVLAYGDYRDDLILELEKRIYNNIKVAYDSNIFDIQSVIPGYNRTSDYSLSEFNKVLAPSFYKWTALIDKDFTKPLSYNRDNSFTFNYVGHSAPDGREVPGYWRGIYKWMLDTDRPNLCPWEMLGYSEEPSWWKSVYGPAPYTSDNLVMWQDLSEGIVRKPGVPVVRLPKYAKPFLMDHIPVDESGNLLSPQMTSIANGIITESTGGDFVFGDLSPIEGAWRRSSYYPFSVLLASMLLTPSNTFGVLLDRSRVVRNLTGQLVYSDTGLRIKPSSMVLPSIQSSSARVQTAGIINYLINYILSDNLKSYTEYKSDLTTITAKLTYRVGAFTSKEKFNLILDSKTPLSAGSVFVPHENYDIIINSSSPIKKITYSGVIITKLVDGFEVTGYSKTQPYFKYYPWIQSGIEINVGGISESYTNWTVNQQYQSGKIVRFNNVYYRVKTTHTSTTIFEAQYFQVLSNLPVIGGRTAILRKLWDKSAAITIPYNTKFRTIQEVVDFLLGYGEYLKDQGFIFDEFNVNISQVTNWETSAKEFLFWTTQNWSTGEDKWQEWMADTVTTFDSIVRYNGDYYKAIRTSPASSVFIENDFVKLDGLSTVGSSVISLSPSAEKVTFKAPLSVVDDISNQFNGYEVFRVDGQPILYEFINSYREDTSVSYTPGGEYGIYGASFYLVQKEQVVILDNTTMFNDTIYNPASGYKQDRIKVSGYVSTDWNGSFDVPGFIFDDAKINDWQEWTDYDLGDIVKYKQFYYSANTFLPGVDTFNHNNWNKLDSKPSAQLLPNWNYKATQFTDFYSLDSDNFDISQQKMAQHLIGYQKRQYLENIIQDDVSEFKFYQGMIIEKGTQNVFNKLFDVLSAEGVESLKFNEEWLVRVGQYGANSSYDNIEFVLDESLFKNNPQGFELVNNIDTATNDFIIRQSYNDVYLKPIGYNNNPWPVSTDGSTFLRSAGYVRPDEVLYSIKSLDNINDEDSNGNKLYPISSFTNGDYIWCAFDKQGWNVYRFTDTDIKVIDITYSNSILKIKSDLLVNVSVDSYIGIKQVNGFAGFYKIVSVTLDTFEVYAPGLIFVPPFAEQDTILLFDFSPQRVGSIDDITSILPKDLKNNEIIWTDDNGNGKWTSWVHSPVYPQDVLNSSAPQSGLSYGKAVQINVDGNILAIGTSNGEVLIYDYTSSFVQRQTISVPFISPNDLFGNNINATANISTVIAMSSDSKWMATGSPLASAAAYTPAATIYDMNITNDMETASAYMNHGVISLYQKDVDNIYTLVGTILSPTPQASEKFGISLAFGNDTLYVGSTGVSGSLTNPHGAVYKLKYSDTVRASASYDPVGSSSKTIKLSSVTDIAVGMKAVGTGFLSGQIVEQVNIGLKTVVLSAVPDVQPSGVINFTTTEWKYDLDNTKLAPPSSTYNFSADIQTSKDGSTLLVSAPWDNIYKVGKVLVYVNDILFDTLTTANDYYGQAITISNTGEYIAVSSTNTTSEWVVEIYKNSGLSYDLYKSVTDKFNESCQFFGKKIKFANDYKTLVVFSANATTKREWELSDGVTFDSDTTKFMLFENFDTGRVDVYNQYSTNWVYSESLLASESISDCYGNSIAVGGNSIVVGAPGEYYNFIHSGVVYTYTKADNALSWSVNHTEIDKVDAKKIKQAFLYNKKSNELISYLDVIDPVQGKIPGIADEEIKYKVFYDPAVYTIGDTLVNVDDGSAWKKEKVGMLWWDLRTTKFVNSNDDDVVYRNSTWSTLASGATVDIYEWVESKYLPADWDSQSDTETGLSLGMSGLSLYGNTSYSVSLRYDNVSQSYKKSYYFWVKNKKTIPFVSGRKMAAQDVSDLIGNPRGQGYKYLALTGTNSFSLINVKNLLKDTDVVLSVEYWTVENTEQNIHSQWKLISENIATEIPLSIENKWIDSLCGKDTYDRLVPDTSLPLKLRYGIENRPRQAMFVNRFEALKQYVEQANLVLSKNLISETRDLSKLESYEKEPSIIRGLYDAVFDTDSELRFAGIGSFRRPSLTPIITDGRVTGITINDSGRGYLNTPFIDVSGSGTGAIVKSIINSAGQITGATIINGGEGYTDYTTFSVRDYSVLVHSDSQTSGSWSIYSYDPTTITWSRVHSQTYDTRKYWDYIDWYENGCNQFSAVTYAVDTYSDLGSIESKVGDLVKIRTSNIGTWVLLEKYSDIQSIDWTQSYKVVGSQNGTIQISSILYECVNTGVGYDNLLYDGGMFDISASAELRIILKSMKNDIFIDELKPDYLNLFFTCVRYALSEQLYVDWIFKTSFIKAQHNVGALKQQVTYKNDNLSNFEEYVAEVKPYRTKIREYVSAYTNVDLAELPITDFDLPVVNDNGIPMIIGTSVSDEELLIDNAAIQTYPWKNWLDNVGFTVTDLTIVDNGSGYVTEPIVRFSSKSGSGTTARAFISDGKVNRVVLLTPGTGYLNAPTVYLEGGLSTTGTQSRVIATIGDSVVRSTLVKMKFDRTSRTYFITQLQEIETFIGSGSRLQFSLKWGPDVRIGTSSVTINGIDALRDSYKLRIVKSTAKGYTSYSGSITFTTAPANNAIITVTYLKDWSLLNAADRINFYYNPQTGDLGKDLSQLMTGVDYGGVIVSGLDFNVSRGWDSTPYYSEKWDTSDPTFDDYITYVAVGTDTFTLPYIPVIDEEINVYHNKVRIDDPNFGTIDQTNNDAVMLPFIGDGVNNVITIPGTVTVLADDEFIFRKTTSDGAIKPQDDDYDTALSGGNLAYSTATGLSADDIIVDGDDFVTTTSSSAPEEVVPGQLVDTLAIKVYDRPSSGSATMNVDNYVGNGTQTSFTITQSVNSPKALIVKVSSNIKTIGVDYTVDYKNRLVVFNTAPGVNDVVSLFCYGSNGSNILDIDHIVCDGIANTFQTRAPWMTPVTSSLYLNGQSLQYELFDSNGMISIRFIDTPYVGDVIDFIIVSGSEQTFAITKSERIAADGRTSTDAYPLSYSIGDSLPIESNMIVRVGQTILNGPNNSYFTIKSNRLTYTIDKSKFLPYSVGVTDIAVYADGKMLNIGTDYFVDLSVISIKLTRAIYSTYSGTTLIVSIKQNQGYFYVPPIGNQPPKILLSETYSSPDIIEVISSYKHDVLDIQRTGLNVSSQIELTPETIEYYYYKNLAGGLISLDRTVLNDNYVWIVKNETLLVPSVDYKLNDDKSSITLAVESKAPDQYTVITYGSNITLPGISYMQFKDMLNRTHFKRLNLHKQSNLTVDLNWNDTTITVVDASTFDTPSALFNKPGIIEIRGERIEYFEKTGNVLSKLRRGTLGTGAPLVHVAGSYVQEIGFSETIPYNEVSVVEQVASDGTNLVTLTTITPAKSDDVWSYDSGFISSIPTTYGQSNDVEVFVGGYNVNVDWAANVTYLVDDIVIIGSYTYRCIIAHTSGSTFDSSYWSFFIGNIRLKKQPYKVHNVSINSDSPEGDVQFDADFAVDNTNVIRLTNKLDSGTLITVVKRTGDSWDRDISIQKDTSKIATFLKAVPGTWYTPMQ